MRTEVIETSYHSSENHPIIRVPIWIYIYLRIVLLGVIEFLAGVKDFTVKFMIETLIGFFHTARAESRCDVE